GRRIGRGAIRNRETAEMNTSERPLRTGAEGEAAPLRGLSEADRTLLIVGDGSGLDVVSAVRGARPGARIVMLTGYGNIATAVAAVKAGALDYLPKPADADAVERALLAKEGGTPEPPEDPMSADR